MTQDLADIAGRQDEERLPADASKHHGPAGVALGQSSTVATPRPVSNRVATSVQNGNGIATPGACSAAVRQREADVLEERGPREP